MSKSHARHRRAAMVAALLSAATLAPPALAAESVVERSAFSTTVQAGNAFKTRTYPEQVNFEDQGGNWKAIDRSLERQPDGTLRPVAVDGDAVIPSSLTRPVVLEHDGRSVSFRLQGADQSADREVEGSKASFEDALSGVDISYKVRPTGLKELITLAGRSSQRTFNYEVRSDSELSAKIDGGDLVFTDASGEERFRVAAPLAWDSAEPAQTANALTLSVTKTGDRQWKLTMRADDKWLDDRARVYPVTLDPDYYWIDGKLRFHGANQDCALAGGSQQNLKQCAYQNLQIGYGNSRPYKSVMRFDIAAAIPAYANATAARFLAWQFPSTQKFEVASRLRTVTSDWDNNSTWNNRKDGTPWTTAGGDVSTDPALIGEPITVGPSGYWSYWPAPLAAVNGWIKNTLPNYGFQVSTDLTTPTVKSAYEFTSTDGNQANWPALEVTWVPDTVAPDPVTNLRVSGYDGSVATVSWDPITDPVLSNGTPGSGVATTSVVATVNGVARPAVTATDEAIEVTGVSPGNRLQVQLTATDRAGNQRTAALDRPNLQPLLDDPLTDAAAADVYQELYPGVARATAEAWITAQNGVANARSGALLDDLRNAATDAGYGGAYYDNAARAFVVRLAPGANSANVSQILSTLPATTRTESAPFSASRLGSVQSRYEDALVDLLDAGKMAVSSSQRLSRLEIRISSTATAAEDARIRNTTTEGVPAVFTVVPPAQINGAALACKWPNCDDHLRGGVEIKSGSPGGTAVSGPAPGQNVNRCTLGFIAKRPNGARVGITAGHCKSDISSNWMAYDSEGAPLTTQLNPVGTNDQFEWSSRGDFGIINLNAITDPRPWVFVTKNKTNDIVPTTRNPHYPIRKAAANSEGSIVCFSGATSGTRCGVVESRNETFTYDIEKFDGSKVKRKVTGLAKVKTCGARGDSGGPVYKAGIAYGIVAAGEALDSGRCAGLYYTGAVTIQALAGVTIAP